MSASPYKQLEQEFRRLHAFRGALALLRWDAAVMMPRGSADVRGEQLAALETEHHALLTAPRITRLLDRAQANTQGLADWQIANLHEMRRQRDHAIATPVTLVSRLTKAASRAESRWLEARAQGKFEAFAPYLEEVVHLVRDKAALLGQAQDWRDQPVGRDRGMALEESQSLLIEMMVCRSRPFVRYVQPLLAKHFGASGPGWDVENVYSHLTRVRRGLIRVDADELTY